MSNQVIKPYENSEKGKKEQVETMFNNISGNYDFLNRLITFGMDKKWRKNMLELLKKEKPDTILDVATGTGDMAILFAKTDAEKIVGIDIAQGMLDIADKKIEKLNLQERVTTDNQNSEELNYSDHSFDAVTVSYGIRNFENLNKGLKEIYRVLNKNGVFIILETSQPTNKLIKPFFLLYTKLFMPVIARLFSKDKNAYKYLSSSAINFPYGEELKKIIKEVGFRDVTLYPQFYGASTIYFARK